MVNQEKQRFWGSRAALGVRSGTDDFILKRIEIKLLLELIHEGSRVLDVGCGNGETLVHLAEKKKVTGVGVDFAPEMINAAILLSQKKQVVKQISFQEALIPGLKADLGVFDYIITERCLINLDNIKIQHEAFLDIMSHLKVGGYYLMIEDSFDGLDKLNGLRKQFDLERIDPPWHNTFFHEKDVLGWQTKNYVLDQFLPFTSTYYFLSRVVYAKLAKDKKEELKYDSDINLLAVDMPNMGDLGAVRMWIWKRKA